MRRSVPGSRGNDAFVSLTVVVVALGIGGVLAATWATVSTQSISDVARMRAGQVNAQLARSAVAETWSDLQRLVNDPASPVARRLRTGDPKAAGSRLPMPGLVHTLDLAGAGERSIQVETRIVRFAPVDGWPSDSVGSLRVVARVRSAGGLERSFDEERQFRVQRVALPAPIHRWVVAPPAGDELQLFGRSSADEQVLADPAGSLRETEPGQLLLDRLGQVSQWRSQRAAFEVPMASGSMATQEWLEKRLVRGERCNGVILIDNKESGPQRLSRLVLRGRMLLVATGSLDLEDVTVENPAADMVSVISYGAVTVAGKVEARILRLVDPAAVGGAMDLCSGSAQMTGSMIDLSGLDTCPIKGSLTAGPTLPPSGSTAAQDPSLLVVLLSPIRRIGPLVRS